MATSSKIRVGIVGVSPQRGFASIAHVPALRALPEFEITAVCTTRQESAEAAARHYGIPLAFSDPEKLAQHPDVDLVTVSVKVPDHYRPVMAAIEAGKHVYCEWPLGRDTAEAVRMLDAAERKGIRHAVGLQGQMSPAINYVKDLVAEGYVGRVLAATMIGCAPNWGATIDRAYQADRANGANLLTITGGHHDRRAVLLPRRIPRAVAPSWSASATVSRSEETGEMIAKTSPDQLVVSGIVGDGAVVSFQIRGGMARGTEFLFEIHGEEGDLVLTATSRASMQRQELNVKGARGEGDGARRPAGSRQIPLGARRGARGVSLQCRSALREARPSASVTASRSAPASTQPSPAIACSMRSCVPRTPGRSKSHRADRSGRTRSSRDPRPTRLYGRFRRRGRVARSGDLDLDGHAEMIGRKAGPGAGDRHRLARVAHDRDADQIVIADDAVGRVEFDPAGPGQVDLEPGMGGAAADPLAAPAFGDVEIAGDKTRGEPERAHRLHHQHREIAAAAALHAAMS